MTLEGLAGSQLEVAQTAIDTKPARLTALINDSAVILGNFTCKPSVTKLASILHTLVQRRKWAVQTTARKFLPLKQQEN